MCGDDEDTLAILKGVEPTISACVEMIIHYFICIKKLTNNQCICGDDDDYVEKFRIAHQQSVHVWNDTDMMKCKLEAVIGLLDIRIGLILGQSVITYMHSRKGKVGQTKH